MILRHLAAAGLVAGSYACALKSTSSPPTSTGTTSGTGNDGATTGTAGVGSGTQSAGNGPTTRYIGRVDTTNPILSWPGNGVQTVFTGTSGSVTFTSSQASNYVGISIDGGAYTLAPVTSGVPISFQAAGSGTHTVSVIKTSEAIYGTLQLAGFQVSGGQQATTLPSRRIEFIGDSITAGYGVDGTAPCTESSALENATDSYAFRTALAVGADPSLIAWSGKGVARNVVTDTSGSATMATLWLQAAATDQNATYTFPSASAPQVVVIHLGTNDFSYVSYDSSGNSYQARAPIDEGTFVAAYVSLVQNVMSKYPGVQVIMCTSPMLSDSFPSASDAQHTTQMTYLQQVATQVGGNNVHVLDFPTQQTGDGINGCDSHPSKAQQQAMATLLVADIKSLMGW